MTIKIEILRKLNSPFVEVGTEFGRLISILEGECQIGETMDVEIDIDDDFFWGKNIFYSEISKYSVSARDNKTIFVAVLESIAPDKTAFMRFGSSFILIDTDQVPISATGRYLSLVATVISLYPTRI